MKKSLMILASVALGASMASAADVESKNVVGFNTLSMSNNVWKQMAMQFDKIGTGTNKLVDLPLDPALWDQTSIQIAYNQGTVVKFKTYKLWATDPNEEGGPAGWYEGSTYVGNTVSIPVGAAFWLIPKSTRDLSLSGEVVPDDLQVSLELNKWQMLCNPYPVDIKLSEMPLSPATWDQTQIQVAYNQGTLVKFKTYKLWASDPNEEGGPAGWYEGSTYVGNSVTVPVGQGFWLIPKSTGTITFTSPL